MKRFAISVLVSFGLGLLLLPLAQAMQGRPRAAGAKLEKTTWWVELKPEGQSPVPDVMVFSGGKFDSVACHAYGFGDAMYEAQADGRAVLFTATTKSAAGETMAWKGKVAGKVISGTMTWQDAKGKSQQVSFSGKRHAASGLLDGTKWSVSLKAEGQKPMPDTLVFEKGTFDSIACHGYGFGKGPYNATKKAAATSFTAFTTSTREGMMQWTGEVNGERVTGSMTWYPTKGEAKKFTFSGARQTLRQR